MVETRKIEIVPRRFTNLPTSLAIAWVFEPVARWRCWAWLSHDFLGAPVCTTRRRR